MGERTFLGFGSVEVLIAFCRFRERVAWGLQQASGEPFGRCYAAVKRMHEADVYVVADELKAKGITPRPSPTRSNRCTSTN